MKITIEISEAQVKGIKDFIRSYHEEKPTNDLVKEQIKAMVNGGLQQGEIYDYIAKYELTEDQQKTHFKKLP